MAFQLWLLWHRCSLNWLGLAIPAARRPGGALLCKRPRSDRGNPFWSFGGGALRRGREREWHAHARPVRSGRAITFAQYIWIKFHVILPLTPDLRLPPCLHADPPPGPAEARVAAAVSHGSGCTRYLRACAHVAPRRTGRSSARAVLMESEPATSAGDPRARAQAAAVTALTHPTCTRGPA